MSFKLQKFVISLIFLSIFPQLSFAIGKVVYFKGKPEIFRNGKKVLVKKGLVVKRQDLVKTDSESIVILESDKKEKLKIKENSRVKLESLVPNNKSIYLLNGVVMNLAKTERPKKNKKKFGLKLNIQVGKKLTGPAEIEKKKSKFKVKTPLASASVRGTHYIVKYSPDFKIALIIVKEGEVLVAHYKLKKSITLKENQAVRVTENGFSTYNRVDWIYKLNWEMSSDKKSAKEDQVDLDEIMNRIEYTDNLVTEDLQEWEFNEDG